MTAWMLRTWSYGEEAYIQLHKTVNGALDVARVFTDHNDATWYWIDENMAKLTWPGQRDIYGFRSADASLTREEVFE